MRVIILVFLSAVLLACDKKVQEVTETSEIPAVSESLIKVNQLGFTENSTKIAIIPGLGDRKFSIISVPSEKIMFTAKLSSQANWAPSNENVGIADFSEFNVPGKYRIQVEDGDALNTKYIAPSNSFVINNNIFESVHDAALKAYYYNRSSTELLKTHAGEYARPAGHPDTHVQIHTSAASNERPAGTFISSPKGWYDAGDYGKYVVNSGITTYTLMIAYEHFSKFYKDRELNIPESGDPVPDVLDEIKWNLDWLQTMQDPNDGGVYHKLTTLNFVGEVMPDKTTKQRYVVQKGTGAALNFAAVMAVASRVYKNFDTQFPKKAIEYQQAAISAWKWAQANPNVIYQQPSDVRTGAYSDKSFNDEFSWAAAELFLLTSEAKYLDHFKLLDAKLQIKESSWANTAALGYISLANNGQDLLSSKEQQIVTVKLTDLADEFVKTHQQSAYRVAMIDSDFVWGSNAVVLNKAIVLLQAYRITQQAQYKQAAIGLLDYVLGKNPTDYSYVTGFGHKPPIFIHHRPSESDQIVVPVPGFVAGGAHKGQQDKCVYPSNLPAKSYLDDFCSYSTNEIAINWNAPLVYVLAAMQALSE